METLAQFFQILKSEMTKMAKTQNFTKAIEKMYKTTLVQIKNRVLSCFINFFLGRLENGFFRDRSIFQV